MKVQIITPGAAHPGVQLGPTNFPEAPASTYDGWRPLCVLGADSVSGLALPSAHPTASTMYAPRGVWTDGQRLLVADSGNHRVLIWLELPTTNGAPADLVLGQVDETSEGPGAGGLGGGEGMHLPTGLLLDQGRLVIADAWHHRILIWESLPTRTGTPPDRVLGQATLSDIGPNRGGEPSANTLYWPFGLGLIDGRFYVADTGNRRVLVWRDGLPETDQPADIVLGQPTPHERAENRGGEVAANSFRWPHAFAATGAGGVLVADAGNHRLQRWDRHPEADCPADAVLGQLDAETGTEFPYVSQAGRLRFPYGLSATEAGLAVADTANNRILMYHDLSVVGHAWPDAVLAQPTLAANGENRWSAIEADTLCWPYAVHWHRDSSGADLLAVADSGNNRVVLWRKTP